MAELPNPNPDADNDFEEFIDSIKEDGTLTRDTGTNSLKAVKESILNLATSMKTSVMDMGSSFTENVEAADLSTKQQSEETRNKISESLKQYYANKEVSNDNEILDQQEEQSSYLESLVGLFRTSEENEANRFKQAAMKAKEKTLEAGRFAKDKVAGAAGSAVDKVKGALPKFGLGTLIKGLGIAALIGVMTMGKEDFEKLKNFFTDKLIPALKSFYEKGLKPLIDNVIKPFLNIAIPALGDSVLSLIEDIGKFFGGLGEAGKMIKEGDYSGAAMKVVTSIGTLVADTMDNILTFGAKLFGVEFAEGESVFTKVGKFASDTVDDVTNYFKEAFNSVVDFLNFGPRLTAWFRANIFDGTGESVKIFGSELPDMSPIIDEFTRVKDNIINSFMEGIVNPIKNLFTVQETTIDEDGNEISEEAFSPLQAIKDKIAALNPFAGLLTKIEDFMSGIGEAIMGLIPTKESITSMVVGALPGFMLNDDKTALSGTGEFMVPDAFEESINTALKAEKRETGGPVQADKPYVVGEAGPELIVPSAAGKVIPAPQTGKILDQASREVAAAPAQVSAPVIAPQSNDNRTIIQNKTVNQGGSMETRNTSPTIRALNSTLAHA